MNAYFLPGVTGLMTGLLLHWAGFDREANLRLALGLRRSYALRTGLTAVGWAMECTAPSPPPAVPHSPGPGIPRRAGRVHPG